MYKKISVIVFLCGVLLSGCTAITSIAVTPENEKIVIDGNIRLLAQLSDQVKETSGLAERNGLIWTINDSGDAPILYSLDSQHQILRKVRVSGAKNTDWEDLAQDEVYLYIADCGNNLGRRDNLEIYKVRWDQLEKSVSDEVPADILSFFYADKPDTNLGRNHNYDCEALASVGDELWLFTKNRGDQKTKLYKLNKEDAVQRVSPVSGFDIKGLITAADYDPETKHLALLGYGKNILFGQSFIWVFPVVNDGTLLPDWSRARYKKLNPYAQWEALIWDRDSSYPKLILTTEKSPLLDVSIGELNVDFKDKGSGSEK
ncbi:MAG: hypothetical protein ACRBB6_06755 [Neptuniibacter sp.]